MVDPDWCLESHESVYVKERVSFTYIYSFRVAIHRHLLSLFVALTSHFWVFVLHHF